MYIGTAQPLPSPPKRIVSLVPSITELLFSLGLAEETAGITKFCVRPNEWFRNKKRIGGTKTVNIEKVRQLKPDLVIANKEENVKEQVDILAAEFPVLLTDVGNLDDALRMIGDIGRLTGRALKAAEIAGKISSLFASLPVSAKPLPAAYLIWREPYMCAGGDCFINDMLNRAGFRNVFSQLARYPVITPDMLRESGCSYLLLSSEPYPFKEKHILELREILPTARIKLVDGEIFSWYGSRLLDAPAYFTRLTGALKA